MGIAYVNSSEGAAVKHPTGLGVVLKNVGHGMGPGVVVQMLSAAGPAPSSIVRMKSMVWNGVEPARLASRRRRRRRYCGAKSTMVAAVLPAVVFDDRRSACCWRLLALAIF